MCRAWLYPSLRALKSRVVTGDRRVQSRQLSGSLAPWPPTTSNNHGARHSVTRSHLSSLQPLCAMLYPLGLAHSGHAVRVIDDDGTWPWSSLIPGCSGRRRAEGQCPEACGGLGPTWPVSLHCLRTWETRGRSCRDGVGCVSIWKPVQVSGAQSPLGPHVGSSLPLPPSLRLPPPGSPLYLPSQKAVPPSLVRFPLM